jgi:tRNA(Arg) A34 adenosine deaminase TadA
MYAHIIKLAIQEAERSIHNKARIGAVIHRKKAIVSSACNRPFVYSNRIDPRFSRWRRGIHAEAAAILKAHIDLRGRPDLVGANIMVIRIGRSGILRLSKPCPWCMAYLQFVGIRTVTYSNNDGKFTTIKI